MDDLILVKHARGAPGLRLFGLGPKLIPSRSLTKLQRLFNENTSWAKNRSQKELKIMLKNSKVILSIWYENKLIGFGRANSDESFRAVLWDIVVEKNFQGHGLGKKIVDTLLKNPSINKVKKVYIMTTCCEKFYLEMGFVTSKNQKLMILEG